MLNRTTIQDSLSPEFLAELAQSFGLDYSPRDYMTQGSFIEGIGYANDDTTEGYDEVEQLVGWTTGEHLWDALWRFGVVIDDDLDWYIPDDYDTVVSLITLEEIV